ncbi:hypothetical protein CDN98_13500 [Roseateles terrae]|nr:hypothetical protein CDN98_13500 [Roseateles terrae]
MTAAPGTYFGGDFAVGLISQDAAQEGSDLDGMMIGEAVETIQNPFRDIPNIEIADVSLDAQGMFFDKIYTHKAPIYAYLREHLQGVPNYGVPATFHTKHTLFWSWGQDDWTVLRVLQCYVTLSKKGEDWAVTTVYGGVSFEQTFTTAQAGL